MDENKLYKLNWSSERKEDKLFQIFEEMKFDMIGMSLSSFGYDKLNEILNIKKTNIRFSNKIYKTLTDNPSNLSVEATAVLMINYGMSGPFIIPPDLIRYMQEEVPSKEELDRYVKNFPRTEELYEKGKIIFEAMIDEGYPSQAAYSLAGATFSECAWNPNVYNKAEQSKSTGATAFASGWANCGEGLFGLTNWSQKEKIIKRLGLNISCDMYAYDKGRIVKGMRPAANGITLDKSKYDKGPSPSNPLLFQCTEKEWIRIMKQYISDLGKGRGDDKDTIDYLMYSKPPQNHDDPDDLDHKLLYASYLFKAGNAHPKTFEGTKKCVEGYKRTHKKMFGEKNANYVPKNGFVEQLMIAYLLAQYVNGTKFEELSLKEIFSFAD